MLSLYYTHNVGDKGGLIETVFFILFTNSFIKPIIAFFSPSYAVKLFKRWRMKKQAANDPEGTTINKYQAF